MKNSKIILGAAACVVTAASALAFKAHNKFGGNHVYGRTSAGSVYCTLSTCRTTLNGTETPAKCHTNVNKSKTAFTGGHQTLWTSVTTVTKKKCGTGITKSWTHAA